MTLKKILTEHDVDALARYASAMFDIPVSVKSLRASVNRKGVTWPKYNLVVNVDSDFTIWIKNRITETGCFSTCCGSSENHRIVTAVFHVFFLHLYESDEMLSRLQEITDDKPKRAKRNRLSSTEVILSPIDRVAQRVVPELQGQK